MENIWIFAFNQFCFQEKLNKRNFDPKRLNKYVLNSSKLCYYNLNPASAEFMAILAILIWNLFCRVCSLNQYERKSHPQKLLVNCVVKWTTVVNFINILRTAFMPVGPKSAKQHCWLNCIFYAFGIYKRVKAVCWTLMKLTPGVPQKLQFGATIKSRIHTLKYQFFDTIWSI